VAPHLPNYNITYVAGTLTAAKAALTVTANNATKVYGAANPSLSVTYSGFLNGDASTVLTTQPTVATTSTTTSSAGSYPITASGTVAANYSFNYVAGVLTVTPATRVFAFGTIASHTYGDTDFSPGATVNTGETITYTTSDPTIATIVNGLVHIVSAGSVTVTASIVSNPNYVDVTPVSQQCVINKAAQSISFNALPVMQVGGSVLSLSLTSSVGLPVTLSSSQPSVAAVSGQNITALSVGSTIITATQAGNINYLPATYSQLLKVQDAVELVKVRPGLSPNGDGVNDFLIIEGIQDYPDNRLTIVNRNGVKMFQTSGYNNLSSVFDGHNSSGDLMQAGTYFYELELHINGETKRKAGYIILKFN
jgi:gliding motility-associated-like protein